MRKYTVAKVTETFRHSTGNRQFIATLGNGVEYLCRIVAQCRDECTMICKRRTKKVNKSGVEIMYRVRPHAELWHTLTCAVSEFAITTTYAENMAASVATRKHVELIAQGPSDASCVVVSRVEKLKPGNFRVMAGWGIEGIEESMEFSVESIDSSSTVSLSKSVVHIWSVDGWVRVISAMTRARIITACTEYEYGKLVQHEMGF